MGTPVLAVASCRGARTSSVLPENGADFCARLVRMEERAGGRVRPPGCRLYSTKATSGRVSQIVDPPRRWMSYAGVGRRGRLSTQQVTWRARLGYSHHACAECAVLRQGVMFSGRMLQFSGTRRVSVASCVRSNRLCSHVWRRMFSRAYTYLLLRVGQLSIHIVDASNPNGGLIVE
jgi:hypothetical protein